MGKSLRFQHWLLVGLLLMFGALFVVRGPMRGISQSDDLAHVYAACAIWLEGGNPYDGSQSVERMERAGHSYPQIFGNGSFYPPSTIAALSPLGLLSWDAARLIWLVINLLACVVLTWSLAHWLTIKDASMRWLLASLLVVAWGPISTSFFLGQLSIVCSAVLFAGLILNDRGKPIAAGCLIAVGCLIKPQLGMGFLLLIALRRDWSALITASLVVSLFTAIGIWRLLITTPQWASDLARNIAHHRTDGLFLDVTMNGPLRHHMIDLQPILHLVLPGSWVSAAAILVVLLLAIGAMVKLFKLGLKSYGLLAASGVALLLMLPVYHRYYDAVLLLPLVVLVVNALARDRRDPLMWVLACCMLIMVFPLFAMVVKVEARALLPEAVTGSWPWRFVLKQCHAWALLLASLVLVAWTWRQVPERAEA